MAELKTENNVFPDQLMQTLSFYEEHALSYAHRTQGLDMGPERERFLTELSRFPGECGVLDAGCGSGRDALAFHRRGLRVTAFDGSLRMAQQARGWTGLAVEHRTFAQMDWTEEFEGVWASASLLHLPPRPLNDALRNVLTALKPGGVFYASFKHGVGARRDAQGRYFHDFTAGRLAEYLAYLGFRVGDVWFSDHKTDTTTRWVNALAFKPLSAVEQGA